jgi:hypothetical protein
MEGYHVRQLGFGTGGPSDVANLWTRELLERAFGDFSAIAITEQDRALAEGNHHVGMSALVDFVGTK